MYPAFSDPAIVPIWIKMRKFLAHISQDLFFLRWVNGNSGVRTTVRRNKNEKEKHDYTFFRNTEELTNMSHQITDEIFTYC